MYQGPFLSHLQQPVYSLYGKPDPIQELLYQRLEIRFTYHYPNLGRASEKMKELLGDTSKVVNSTESEIVFKGKSLELDEKNEDLQDYTNDSENSGIPISLKIQGLKKTIKTGKRPKSFELEELDFQGDPMAYSKLLDTLNHGL